MPLVEITGLEVQAGPLPILRGVHLAVEAGTTLGVVGESGCGKSMTGLSLMGMLPPAARITGGTIKLAGRELQGLPEKEWRSIRGKEIAMVMQDPFTSLNPMMRVGDQIAEVYRLHQGMSKSQAWEKAVEMVGKVGVPNPPEAARRHPHQLSGGQRQRIVIGIAFAARPKALIADEPTTALDVTLQAQILRLLRQLQDEVGTAVILITHDIGVIAAMAHRVAVFYAGQVVEEGSVEQVLRTPGHPYTQALLDSLPDHRLDRLRIITGQPPLFSQLPPGCSFAPRCPHRHEKCDAQPPLVTLAPGHGSACWLGSPKSTV
jgi:oligopeptide/dipeptide ABC transporter ATP-binding protein